MATARQDYRLRRLDANRLELPNASGIPVRVFANDGVLIERGAIDELEALLGLQDTLERMYAAEPGLFDEPPGIEAISLSPDLHQGTGIPIGTTMRVRGALVPQAVGSDWNCGMRVHVTGLTGDQVRARLPELETRLRAIFFGGERHIGLNATQRQAMLAGGIPHLLEHDALVGGAWERAYAELGRINGGGGVDTNVLPIFDDYIRGSGDGRTTFDSQLGSLGGGNHFLEIQEVTEIADGPAAYAWGLRPGQAVIMVHTGSLGMGHIASTAAKAAMAAIMPSIVRPANGIMALPLGEAAAPQLAYVLAAARAATNFAYVNRFYLARMAARAIAEALGRDPGDTLLYDSPHNLLWPDEVSGVVTHRKGSTPAHGPEAMQDTPFAYWGEPVIVPGSMGDASVLLRGLGNPDALRSACHGAGRALSRGDAARMIDQDAGLDALRVVTPVDPRQLAARPDMLREYRATLKQEAPGAYKAVGPAVATLAGSGVAQPVACLRPILTVKG